MKNLLPRFIHDKYKTGEFSGAFPVLSLFVDISGFTAMTEQLMQHGKEGAEVLAETLQAVFDPLIQIVLSADGIVTGFAGDAFTTLFPHPDYARVLLIARQIHYYFEQQPAIETRYGRFTFAVKMGLGDGECEWSIIESVAPPDRYTYLFLGSAIAASTSAENQAGRGEIILTRHFQQRIQEPIIGEYLNGHYFRLSVDPSAFPWPTHKPDPWRADPAILSRFLPNEVIAQEARGEFRQIVSVFISIRRFTSTSAIHRFLQTVFRLADQYRGTITRLDYGDKGYNLLLFWGAPVRYENDVERALDFVLALPQEVPEELRVGVTRRIMYAGLAGSSLQGEFTCYGQGINLAARLMMSAEWGEIRLDENIVRSAGFHYEVEWVGRLPLKGFTEPQRVCRLLGRQQHLQVIQYRGQLVGRDTELMQLRDFVNPLFQPDSDRFGGVFVVYGEAGMGKSRLVYEFQEELTRHYPVKWLFCPADEILRLSLNPLLFMLKDYFHQVAHEPASVNQHHFEEIWNRLIASLAVKNDDRANHVIAELSRVRSLLAALLHFYYPGELYDQLDASLRFENTLSALKTLLKAFSLLQPLVIQLEDIQWYDADSQQFLAVLTRGLTGFPIAILATSRHTENGEQLDLQLDPDVRLINLELGYLTEPGISALAGHILASPISSSLTRLLLTKTQGNPFFVEQVVLNLKEQGLLESNGQTGEFEIESGQIGEIPTHINSVLVSRLDRLPLAVKQVVQTAAVLGWDFEVPVLIAMLQNDPDIEDKLKQAAQSAIWNAESDIRYVFKHALMRDAAYDMQLRSRLKELHHLAAQAIESVFAGRLETRLADLAHHYEQAEDVEHAIKYLDLAGNDARKKYQNTTAINFFERLLKLLPEVEEYSAQRIEALIDLGKVFQNIGHWEDAEIKFQRGLELANKLGRIENLAYAHHALGNLFLKKSRYGNAQEHLQHAQVLYQKIKDWSQEADILLDLGMIHQDTEDFPKAMEYYQKSLNLYEELQDKNGMANAYGNLGMILWLTHEFDKAKDYLERQLTLSRETNYLKGISGAIGNLGNVYLCNGEFDRALENYQEYLRISQELGDRMSEALAYGNIGGIYELLADDDKALEYYHQGIAIAKEIGFVYFWSSCSIICARLYFERKEIDLAESLLVENYPIVKELGMKQYEYFGEELELMLAHYHGDPSAIGKLRDMIDLNPDPRNKAYLLYVIWDMTKDLNDYQQAVLSLQKVCQVMPAPRLRRFLDIMESDKLNKDITPN